MCLLVIAILKHCTDVIGHLSRSVLMVKLLVMVCCWDRSYSTIRTCICTSTFHLCSCPRIIKVNMTVFKKLVYKIWILVHQTIKNANKIRQNKVHILFIIWPMNGGKLWNNTSTMAKQKMKKWVELWISLYFNSCFYPISSSCGELLPCSELFS